MGSTSRSEWRDEATILRDLQYAQGWVPGGISAFVANGSQPPPPEVTEETEEEYYSEFITGGDHSAGPDLTLIKKMLDMVHGDEESEEDETELEQIEIMKLKPVLPVFVKPVTQKSVSSIGQTASAQSEKTKEADTRNKPRRGRNVAIESILSMLNEIPEEEETKKEPVKLSKPEDFVNKQENSINVEKRKINPLNRRLQGEQKVNNWLQAQDAATMFKKKSPVKSPKRGSFKPKPDLLESGQSFMFKKKSLSPAKSLSMSPVEINRKMVRTPVEYVPSSYANEYYEKCLERCHMRELVQKDIWSNAEEKMKEIDRRNAEDERKKQEEQDRIAREQVQEVTEYYRTHKDEDSSDSDSPDEPEDKSEGIAKLLLPNHRHLLSEDCVVCEVITKGQKNQLTMEPEESNNMDTCATLPCEAEEKIIEKPNKTEVKKVETNSSDEEHFVCVTSSSLAGTLTDYELVDIKCTQLVKSSSFEELDLFSSQ